MSSLSSQNSSFSEGFKSPSLAHFHPSESSAYQQTSLSFDDGPHAKNTSRLLDIAKDYDAKFTFFVIGQRAAEHKELLTRMRDEGHEIGNHSWTHLNFKHSLDNVVKDEVERCHRRIFDVTGTPPKLFRPPYGAIHPHQKLWLETTLGYQIALWNLDTLDWRHQNCEAIYRKLTSQSLNNLVVLLHDIYNSTIVATQKILERVTDQKMRCLTISELRTALGSA